MNYHLFVTANPERALTYAQNILATGNRINQVFFYFTGITQLHNNLALATEWTMLIPYANGLKLCKNEVRQDIDEIFRKHFIISSLVDFFSEHWKDQGMLIQF